MWRNWGMMLALGVCGVQSPALAGSYTYTLLAAPGAPPGRTQVTGIGPDSGAVGSFSDASGATHGFVWHRSPRPGARGFYTQIDVPGGSDTQLLGISPRGVAVGTFMAPGTSGETLFTYDVATRHCDTAITGRSDLSLDSAVINRAGVIVGQANLNNGFIAYEVRGGIYRQTRRPAGSQSFYWSTAINTTGLAGGLYFGGVGQGEHAYTFDHGLAHAVDVPGGAATYSFVSAVTDAGGVIGSYFNPAGDELGFVTNGASVSSFGFPGAKYTQLVGQTAAGALIGMEGDDAAQEGVVLLNGSYSVMTLPYPHLEYVILQHVNELGSAVGLVLLGPRQFPFVAYCAVDQVPCTH